MTVPQASRATGQDIATVQREPLKYEVFHVLHGRILAGRYSPGTWMRQEEIATELGVSMSPVREALDLLVSAGLAERVPYRGVRILSLSGPEIVDSYAVRLLLECAVARAAASHASAAQLAELHRLLDRSQNLVGLDEMEEERVVSRQLHSAVAEASGNPLLHKIYLTVLNAFPDWLLYEHLFRQPDLLEDSMASEYREHQRIVEALDARDPAAAVQRTLEHVTNRGREMETHLGICAESLRKVEADVLPLVSTARAQEYQPHKEFP